jgi:hypothetical protein
VQSFRCFCHWFARRDQPAPFGVENDSKSAIMTWCFIVCGRPPAIALDVSPGRPSLNRRQNGPGASYDPTFRSCCRVDRQKDELSAKYDLEKEKEKARLLNTTKSLLHAHRTTRKLIRRISRGPAPSLNCRLTDLLSFQRRKLMLN